VAPSSRENNKSEKARSSRGPFGLFAAVVRQGERFRDSHPTTITESQSARRLTERSAPHPRAAPP